MLMMLSMLELMSVIVMMLFILSYFMKLKTHHHLKEKASVFECGFDPDHKMRASFSLRFFVLTVLFLIFDIELTMIFCLPLMVDLLNMMDFFKINSILFCMLLLGLWFEWDQGALKWN